ncbi:hypothetical protein B0H19DRAFT_1080310 [Mycena capillaripes]|nr:hypothetical protein B0H19DRAFT_1080310 [Mycena capillaripes]
MLEPLQFQEHRLKVPPCFQTPHQRPEMLNSRGLRMKHASSRSIKVQRRSSPSASVRKHRKSVTAGVRFKFGALATVHRLAKTKSSTFSVQHRTPFIKPEVFYAQDLSTQRASRNFKMSSSTFNRTSSLLHSTIEAGLILPPFRVFETETVSGVSTSRTGGICEVVRALRLDGFKVISTSHGIQIYHHFVFNLSTPNERGWSIILQILNMIQGAIYALSPLEFLNFSGLLCSVASA